MTRAEALAELKKVLRETTYDAAWGDTLLISYMAEGQDKFCEGTGYIRDFTTNDITLVEGQKVYAIPDRTIQVLDIWDGTRRLGKFREEDRHTIRYEWDPRRAIDRDGAPKAWQTDRTTGFIEFDSSPLAADAGDTYDVFVWRYSLYDLSNNDIDGEGTPASIEIPAQFHRAPIEYAAYKALLHHDLEQQDKVKSQDHYANFLIYLRDGKRMMQHYHGLETRIGTDQSYVW